MIVRILEARLFEGKEKIAFGLAIALIIGYFYLWVKLNEWRFGK